MTSIAANIQFARHARGMSEAGLAVALGVDEHYITLIENGDVKPSSYMATRLADALRERREHFLPSLKPGE